MSRIQDTPQIEIGFRIPGQWAGLHELIERLPDGFAIDEEHFRMPDGVQLGWNALPADAEFAEIFAQSCERMPSQRDREAIEDYQVNFCLWGPGGSLTAAHRMMQAAAAVLEAGGAGVFIDNSAKAHGSDDWHALTGDPEGGPFWAYVSFIGAKQTIYTLGMHALGYRDASIQRSGDDELDRFLLGNFLGHSYRSGVALGDGHIVVGEGVPSFRLKGEACEGAPEGSPAHNPYGVWKLMRVRVEEG